MKKSRILLIFLSLILATGVSYAIECWSWDGNETGCNLQSECNWYADDWAYGGGCCDKLGCWNYQTESACDNSTLSCRWQTMDYDGWCEEKGCWNFWNLKMLNR